jgi:hypothetical protein
MLVKSFNKMDPVKGNHKKRRNNQLAGAFAWNN